MTLLLDSYRSCGCRCWLSSTAVWKESTPTLLVSSTTVGDSIVASQAALEMPTTDRFAAYEAHDDDDRRGCNRSDSVGQH